MKFSTAKIMFVIMVKQIACTKMNTNTIIFRHLDRRWVLFHLLHEYQYVNDSTVAMCISLWSTENAAHILCFYRIKLSMDIYTNGNIIEVINFLLKHGIHICSIINAALIWLFFNYLINFELFDFKTKLLNIVVLLVVILIKFISMAKDTLEETISLWH